MSREPKTIDGVTYRQTWSGQKRRYGGTHTEYEVLSDLPAEEVERICRERVHPCELSDQAWREQKDGSMDSHFKYHYSFAARGPGIYHYAVHFPSTH